MQEPVLPMHESEFMSFTELVPDSRLRCVGPEPTKIRRLYSRALSMRGMMMITFGTRDGSTYQVEEREGKVYGERDLRILGFYLGQYAVQDAQEEEQEHHYSLRWMSEEQVLMARAGLIAHGLQHLQPVAIIEHFTGAHERSVLLWDPTMEVVVLQEV